MEVIFLILHVRINEMAELHSQTGFLNTHGAPLYYEVAGTGHPLLLIHSGITDCRMWDDQFQTFAQQYQVIRYDLRGYGKSTIPSGKFANHEDVTALFEHLGIKQAHVIGISIGGLIALDFTLAHPDKVTSLVLGAPDVSGRESSSTDLSRFAEEEEALLERGDLNGATNLNLRMWLDVSQRTPDQVDPTVRQRIYEMQYHAFTVPIPDEAEAISLEPPAITRLSEIHVPTLLIVGEYDIPDKIELVGQLVAEISNARQIVISDAAHIVNMEQPAEFNRVILDFLKDC
jgi:pimeloyl-ACP methyl ester carboxylesterase